MGLDMYLYRAKKPEMKDVESFVGKEMMSIDDIKGMTLISLQGYQKEDNLLIKQLLPYCQVIQMTSRELSLDKIIHDYHVQGSLHIDTILPDNIQFYYYPNDDTNNERVDFEISAYVIEEKYSWLENINVAVCYMDEVYYWRGDSGSQVRHFIHKSIDGIDNCGYYKVPDNMIEKLQSYLDTEIYKDENEAFIYHEWY